MDDNIELPPLPESTWHPAPHERAFCPGQVEAYARAAILADRARQAPAPVEVSRLAEEVKAAQVVIGDETVNYGRNHERTIAARVAFHMAVDRLAAAASTPVDDDVKAAAAIALLETLGCEWPGPNASQWKVPAGAFSPAPAASKGAEAVIAALPSATARANQDAEMLHGAHEVIRIWNERARKHGFDGVAGMLNAFRHGEISEKAVPSEPEAQKAVAYSPEGVLQAASDYADQRVMATKGRAGPVEVAEALEHLREVVIAYGQVNGQISSPSPAASMEVQGQRYAEWLNLAKHGQWSNGIPDWARDQRGLMSDSTAMRAVIEELAALAAKNGWRLGEGQ